MVAKLRLTVPTWLLDTLAQLAQSRGMLLGRLARQFIDEGIERLQQETDMIDASKVYAATKQPQSADLPHDGVSQAQAAEVLNGSESELAPLGDAEADLEALRQRAITGDAAAEGAYVRLVGEKWIRLREVLDEAEGRM